MIEFVIGGKAQGKLQFILKEKNLTEEDVCNGELCDYNNIDKRILYNFHSLCRRLLKDKVDIISFTNELLENNKDLIIISDEIGYGIVPIDKEERAWREETGRACINIAKKAAVVTRIISGFPVKIKNEITIVEDRGENVTSSSLKVALIRHGATEGNKKKRYIGSTDENLSLNGICELFDSIAKEIYPIVSRVYTSPMKRCVETAKMIYPKVDIEVVEDLRETNFGDFENKTYNELKDNLDYQRWLASKGVYPIPNGESRESFSKRCHTSFEEIVNKSLGEECIALVVHGGTIMSILDKYSSPNKDFYEWQVKNGQGYLIEINKNQWINNKQVSVIDEIQVR